MSISLCVCVCVCVCVCKCVRCVYGPMNGCVRGIVKLVYARLWGHITYHGLSARGCGGLGLVSTPACPCLALTPGCAAPGRVVGLRRGERDSNAWGLVAPAERGVMDGGSWPAISCARSQTLNCSLTLELNCQANKGGPLKGRPSTSCSGCRS